jgi:hypothetical protein
VAVALAVAAGVCAAEDASPAQPAAPAKADDEPPTADANVHACAGAGRWFPDDPDHLAKLVDAYLKFEAPPLPGKPVALIVPHAGYQYSGPTAGRAFRLLQGRAYKRIILMGLSHQMPLKGASVLRVEAYETPLGRIPVDVEAVDALLKCPAVTSVPAAHRTEHSVENQLPMLQRAAKDFKMVEILVGDLSAEQRKVLADAVRPLADADTLLVVSSDFCHYGPNYGYTPFRDRVPENLQALNNMAMQRIISIDPRGWDTFLEQTKNTVCGRAAIGLLLEVARPWQDIRAARVGVDMSGRITGDWTNSVTYASVAFWRAGDGLSEAEQQTLLRLARDAVTHFLQTGERLAPGDAYDLTPALRQPGAAFVTLKNKGALRGCIGHIMPVGPLSESIIENACQACTDSRFRDNPVTAAEAPALEIEISVLTPMRRVQDTSEIQVGRDGLLMALGRQRGVFLPQVPVEQGWNLDQYLIHLCGKAGLPPEARTDPRMELYRFQAQVFHQRKETAEK